MSPLFSLSCKSEKIKKAENISEKILSIIKDLSKKPEIVIKIRHLIFNHLTKESENSSIVSINYRNFPMDLYPKKYTKKIFLKDRFSQNRFKSLRLIYILDLWKNNKRFFRISKTIIYLEILKIKTYNKSNSLMGFGKREENIIHETPEKIEEIILGYR
ncbi:MAG: hypothetical protein QW037_04600 [Thermoplasmata archaeon]